MTTILTYSRYTQEQLFDYANSDFLRDVGMTVSSQPMKIDGQVIAPPQITYQSAMVRFSNKSLTSYFTHTRQNISHGKWNITGETKLARPARLNSWCVMFFDVKVTPQSRQVQRFIEALTNNMKDRGRLSKVMNLFDSIYELHRHTNQSQFSAWAQLPNIVLQPNSMGKGDAPINVNPT